MPSEVQFIATAVATVTPPEELEDLEEASEDES